MFSEAGPRATRKERTAQMKAAKPGQKAHEQLQSELTIARIKIRDALQVFHDKTEMTPTAVTFDPISTGPTSKNAKGQVFIENVVIAAHG